MKPPPRIRNKPNRSLTQGQETRDKAFTKWQRAEHRKLVTALKTLSGKTGGHGDIDYNFLKKEVSTRSISEIHSVIEYLKKKVIGSVNSKLTRKILQGKKIRKPIEVWTHMASTVAGTLEEPISAAFSQMLLISSTEPRSLRNCDPPQVHRLSTDADRPVGHTIPCSPVRGDSPGTSTAQPIMLFKTPAPTIGPAKRLSTSFKVVKVSNSGIQNSPRQQPSTTAGTPPAATCSSLNTIAQLPTVTTLSSDSSSVSTTSSSSSVPTLSPSTTATHAKSSSTSKHTEKDKSLVDFEKIYHYLSVINKPDKECHMTPMESAIILNLMMSLPEELPLLDCTKLHQHLIQMHQCLTSPAKSKMTREDRKGGLCAQTSKPSGRGSNTTDGQQQTARIMDSSGDQEDTESQSSGSNNGESQSGNVDGMGFCPPLNPFVVPLKLLMRR
nr:snRNA-activating protein complex subunit 2 [Solea senegalensis]